MPTEFRLLTDLVDDFQCRKKFCLYFYENFYQQSELEAAEISQKSSQLAIHLIKCGVQPGEPVLLCLNNSAEFVICFFAILKAGAVAVPMATKDYVSASYFSDLSKHLVEVTRARFVFSHHQMPHLTSLSPNLKQNLSQEDLKNFKNVPRQAQDLAVIQFSSGSTQAPKGVCLTHEKILVNIAQILEGMQVTEKEILSSWLPFYHDMGLVGGLLSSMAAGVVGHFMGAADFLISPQKWVEHVSATKASVIMGPNLLYRTLSKKINLQQNQKLDLKNIRLALIGSEPVSERVMIEFAQKFKGAGFREEVFFPVYGMAENVLAISFPSVGEKTKVIKRNSQAIVSCGRPLRGVQVRIWNEKNLCQDNEIGEIEIRTPSMTEGYFRNSEATAQLFHEGWLRTGDLGFVLNDEIYISGRKKEVLIINGKKIFPQDIEHHLVDAKNSAGAPLGRVMVFADFEKGDNGYSLACETKAFWPWQRKELKRQLALWAHELTWEVPKAVYVVPSGVLPKTSSGKSQRLVASDWAVKGKLQQYEKIFLLSKILTVARGAFWALWQANKGRWKFQQSPPSEKELLLKLLLHIFAEATQIPVEKIDIHKNFIDYKLDSLQIVQFNVQLKDKLAEVPLVQFVGIRNLNELTHHLMTKHPDSVRQLLQQRGMGVWRRQPLK